MKIIARLPHGCVVGGITNAVPRRPPVTVGGEQVARNLLQFWGQPATLVTLPLRGQPALLGFIGGELAGVLMLTMRGDLIQSVNVIGDPHKLAFLRSQLSARA
ncbi:MAG TPA: hypothetical protein VMA32_16530 [Streptosporangiaceae bacterium]|nr:hypothetical protein [Streptosporangiaceae bacterium]